MSRLWIVSASAGLLLLGAGLSPAIKAEGPSQEPSSLDRQALDLLRARCILCHSADLIAQQRLERGRWASVLNKMRSWGAQLSEPERDLLLDYLVARLNPDAKKDLFIE